MTASASDFAHTIRSLRLRAGLSQEELAERAGVSARAISDMERGLRKNPRPETLRLLSAALQLSEAERAHFFAAANPGIGNDQQRAAMPPATTTIPLAIRPLPIPPDELVGREADIGAIGALMHDECARLVTLTGPGGVGKTRLALAVAERLQYRWTEGAAFVDLAPLENADRVAPAIALALGLTFDACCPAPDTVMEALRDRSLLLVLDNMEHLLAASAWISQIVAEAHHLTVLVTSRGRLRIRGEYAYQVAPLAVPSEGEAREGLSAAELLQSPAVQLFRDRARQTGYGFVLDDRNAPVVAELCRRLDGLPLAIELAASRVGLLPPESLLDQLATLSGGHRDSPDRQQTLQQAIDWSYDLLDPATQTVYRRLAGFTGGFTLDAAEAVAGDPEIDVLISIGTLVENSLLTPVPGARVPRFTMLETIHRDAEARLERSDEASVIRRRHANWLISLVEAAGIDMLFSRNSRDWYARLDAELANLRRAVAFLIESGDEDGVAQVLAAGQIYFVDRLSPDESAWWFEAALPLTVQKPDRARVIALSYLIISATFLNDRARAESAIGRLQQWTSQVDDPLAIGMSSFAQGVFCQIFGRYIEAAILHRQALGWFEQAEAPAWVATAMMELGDCLLLSGATDEAWAIIDKGVAFASALGSAPEMAYGLLYLGFAGLSLGDLRAAAAGFTDGLDLALEHRIARISLGCMGGMAGVAHANGNPELAAQLLGAVEAARRSGRIQLLANQSLIDDIATRVRSDLGSERDAALRNQGALLTFEQAVDLARTMAGHLAEPPGSVSITGSGKSLSAPSGGT